MRTHSSGEVCDLLRRERSLKVGIHAKRLNAGGDHDYLLRILVG